MGSVSPSSVLSDTIPDSGSARRRWSIERDTWTAVATASLETDGNGLLPLPALEPGAYEVAVTHGTRSADRVTLHLIAGRTTRHTFVLPD